jgi:hypothetical protein
MFKKLGFALPGRKVLIAVKYGRKRSMFSGFLVQ